MIGAASYPGLRCTLLLVAALACACFQPSTVPIGADRCQTPGTDPFELTALGPTDRSQWLQPWRAYLDTWPASRMRDAIGIGVPPMSFDTQQLSVLSEHGFVRGLFVVQWAAAQYSDPQTLNDAERMRLVARLQAMRKARLRPLLLLYGHEGSPAPLIPWRLNVIEAAPAGARTLKISAGDVARIVPGRTGFDELTGYIAAEVLITIVDSSGNATLSRPLPVALASGEHDVSTLAFSPWTKPILAGGQPNPTFEDTLSGWLAFVRSVVAIAQTTLGDDEFDIELWNELVTGSRFLNINNYYDPPIDSNLDVRTIARAIVTRTTAMFRSGGLSLARMGIGNGFANTDWSFASSTEDPGITALDRHISNKTMRFPDEATLETARALDATGAPAGHRDSNGVWIEAFSPTYDVLFPELPLTAILPYAARRPGQLIRDLAPITTLDENGVAHGRNVGPPGAKVPPAVWITAVSTRPRSGTSAPTGWSDADRVRFQTKSVLRTLSAYVSKGASALYFYAPEDELALIDHNDPTGGPILQALSRFRAAFDGPSLFATSRNLSFIGVRGCDASLLLKGNGTTAFPDLARRDAVAFFPFQKSDTQFVAATYVMTRDLMQEHAPGTAFRFDLPEREYDLVIEGVRGNDVLVEASDPMDGRSIEVTVKSRSANRIVVTTMLNDSVRFLHLSEP
ncbi:MAG: hypothetical protein SGI86_10975 [Deltaproteobacteria bacterium]|nr:hypothetical protein [Deltaproteobacteria bacterium]